MVKDLKRSLSITWHIFWDIPVYSHSKWLVSWTQTLQLLNFFALFPFRMMFQTWFLGSGYTSPHFFVNKEANAIQVCSSTCFCDVCTGPTKNTPPGGLKTIDPMTLNRKDHDSSRDLEWVTSFHGIPSLNQTVHLWKGTVDGSEIRKKHQLRLVAYPSIYKVLYISGGCWGISSIKSMTGCIG